MRLTCGTVPAFRPICSSPGGAFPLIPSSKSSLKLFFDPRVFILQRGAVFLFFKLVDEIIDIFVTHPLRNLVNGQICSEQQFLGVFIEEYSYDVIYDKKDRPLLINRFALDNNGKRLIYR